MSVAGEARAGIETLAGVSIAGRSGNWSLVIEHGRIASLDRCDKEGGGLVLPLFADVHAHLDKTYTSGRIAGRPSSLQEAIEATETDKPNWTREDLERRAETALERAFSHGTCAMRSHVDWAGSAMPVAWKALKGLKETWLGRVDLQLASLTPLDDLVVSGQDIARQVAGDGEVLGAFVCLNDDLERKVAKVFELADRFGLDLDFHVDETLDPLAIGFDAIVGEAARRDMGGRVLCSHACSLSVRPEGEVALILGRAADAGVGLVALPTTNAYLQDCVTGRTPRMRGIAPLHEAHEEGVATMLASDNVRDAFYPYGDYDLLDVYRCAALSARLDDEAWLATIGERPAAWLGTKVSIGKGASADFNWYDACNVDGLLSDPRTGHRLWRDGMPVPAASDRMESQ